MATSATTGSLTVAGGAGIAKELYTGGIGVVLSTEDATTAVTGSLLAKGGMGVAKRLYAGSAIVALGTTEATTATTGSLVSAGGLGVAGRIYSGGAAVVTAFAKRLTEGNMGETVWMHRPLTNMLTWERGARRAPAKKKKDPKPGVNS